MDHFLRTEDRSPRCVKIEPALRAEPARRHLGNMQQAVSHDTDQLGAVPGQESSRRLTHTRRMRQLSEADWAALALIS